LPFTAGAGVGVVPASIDPVIEKNVAARAQANLMTRERGDFREMIFAFMGWGLSLSAQTRSFSRGFNGRYRRPRSAGIDHNPWLAPCRFLEQVAFRQGRQ
jgi:hypothetical protein